MSIISVEPLAKRILDIASTAVGSDGRIVPVDSFRFDSTAEKSLELISQDVEVRPVFEIEDIILTDANAFSEIASVAQYDLKVLLRITYRVNQGLPDLDRTNLIVRMRNDVHLVRRALGNPETLSLWNSPSGDVDTGLASGCLEFESASKILWIKADSRTALASQTLTFSGKLFLDYVGYPASGSVSSGSVVGGWYVPLHASTHRSGSTDYLNAQDLGAFGVPANYLLISNGAGGWTTIASSSVGGGGGVTDHGALAGLGDDDHPHYLLRTDFNPFSASVQDFSGTLLAASATFRNELNSLTSSVVRLDAASGTFRTQLDLQIAASAAFATVSSSYKQFSASYVAFSATWSATDVVLTNASATFRNELNSLTSSVVRLNAASGTFRSELNSQTASISLLTAFSSSHASRHLSGGADPIDAQLLRGNGIPTNHVLISNGAGGWTTVISTSVGSPPGAPASHASTHLSGASDAINAQDLGASGIAANRLLISNNAGGWTTVASSSITGKDYDAFTASVQSATASLQSATASLQTVSASYLAFSASYVGFSATWSATNVVLTNASATFRNELNSQTASINLLTAFSNSHASRHLSGGADPIDAQSLRANGVGANQLLISNNAGGWTTIASSSVGGGSSPTATAYIGKGFIGSEENYYSNTTASVCQGGNVFFVAVLADISAVPANGIDRFVLASKGDDTIIEAWSIAYHPNSYNPFVRFQQNGGSFVYLQYQTSSILLQGKTNCFILAFSESVGIAQINGTRLYQDISAYNVVTEPLYVASGTTGVNVSGTILGLGYFSGNFSQNQLNIIGARAAIEGSLPEDVVTWTTLWRGQDLQKTGSVVSSSAGHPVLRRSGAVEAATSYTHTGGSTYTISSFVTGSFTTLATASTQTTPDDWFDKPPITFISSSPDLVELKRQRSSVRNYLFDDFISFSASGTLGFGITIGANATVVQEAVDTFTLKKGIGNAVGLLNMQISTNAATQGIVNSLSLGSGSFSLNMITSSILEWRLTPSGTSAANSQRRTQFGWLSNLASGATHLANDQQDGIYFEMSATNANWRLIAASAGVRTIYDSGIPVDSGTLKNYAIVITGSHLNIPTASFFINNTLIGVISSTMPVGPRLVWPGIKTVRLTGTAVNINTFVDYFEFSYEINR